jgi:acyl-CoA thioesterase-1
MTTMICIGDSLTEGTDIPVGHTWPALVANALSLEVINCGIGGDTTNGMLSRFYPDVVDRRPAFAFIMGGTNDLWWGWEANTILGNLFSMVVQARHHGIAPVIGLPVPVNVPAAEAGDFSPPWGGYARFTASLAKLLEALTRHAAESEVAVVDLHHPFLGKNQQVRTDLFLPDGLHPNKPGQLTIAREIAIVFRQDLNFS